MERVRKVLSARSRFHKALNHAIHAGNKPGWYMKEPGFKIDDFNRAGLPSVAKISRMGEMNYLMNQEMFGYRDEMAMVLKGRQWTFSPDFYSRAAVNFPMTLHGCVSRVGQSSFDAVQKYFADDGDDGRETHSSLSSSNSPLTSASLKEPLFSGITRLVCVDSKRWKVAPWPEHYLRVLSTLTVASDETFPNIVPPTTGAIPGDAFKCRVTVRYDDLDHQFHANQASYLLYATECAAQATRERYYSRIVEDVAFYPVKRACGLYMAETMAGDEVEVSTWEDTDDKMCLHFATCKGQNLTYYAKISFFDSVL